MRDVVLRDCVGIPCIGASLEDRCYNGKVSKGHISNFIWRHYVNGVSVDDAADGYLHAHTLTHLPRHGPGKRVGGWAGMWEIGKEQQWRGVEEPHLPTCTPSYSELR